MNRKLHSLQSPLILRIPCRWMALFLMVVLSGVQALLAQSSAPIILDARYNHDRWKTRPSEIVRNFEAYTVSFDGTDDDNKDGTGDNWAIPHWVAYEVKQHAKMKGGPERPAWFTDQELFEKGIAPNDASYKYPNALKTKFPFDRGHMCPKFTAFRMGAAADAHTHCVLNAVPQWNSFNSGIWAKLERKVDAWADRYGSVWVICGPIVDNQTVTKWLGEAGEVPVAIPDAIFKIVIKEGPVKNSPDVLAFIYPNIDISRKATNHEKYLVSVGKIEAKTGLNFLSSLSLKKQKAIESSPAKKLWD